MLDTEFDKFQRAFTRLAGLFRLRLHGQALDDLTRSYFKILSEHDLTAVFDGAKAVIEKQRTFPKPIEWLRAIPTRRLGLPTVTVPDMTDEDANAWTRAHDLRWEDAPCACVLCQRAGVSDKPLRFVPEYTDDDHERRVRNVRLDRVVTAGHWAHGTELAGYYRGREEFYTRFHATLGRKGLALVPREREPGEEG
jgi:hypothetical protein